MNERTRSRSLELRARDGRAVVLGLDRAERDPDGNPVLPVAMVRSLHEWAHVAQALDTSGGGAQGNAAELVSRRGRQLAGRIAERTGTEVTYVDPVSGLRTRVPATGPRTARDSDWPQRHTPWATGLTLSTIVAVLVLVALMVVSLGLAEVSVLLSIGVNLAAAAGFAPSIWLARSVPAWRWVALGMATGIAASWVALLLSALG